MRRTAKMSVGLVLGVGGLLSTAPTMAPADVLYLDSGDVVTTTSVIELPRTYIVPSSYQAGSSRIVPSSYRTTVYELSPASVVMPTTITGLATTTYIPTTTYLPTTSTFYPTRASYRRAMRYRRRSYVSYEPLPLSPTYYVAPSTALIPSGMVASSSICCGSGESTAMSYPAPPARPMGGSAGVPSRVSGAPIESRAAGELPLEGDGVKKSRDREVDAAGGTRSDVGTPPTRDAYKTPVDPKPPAGTGTPTGGMQPPANPRPADPVLPKDPVGPATKARESQSPPPRPEPDPLVPVLPPAPEIPKDELLRRDSYKPTTTLRPTPTRNILQGKVIAAFSRQPEENVEVVLADRMGRFADRTARTNAFGEFALSLPEGDWAFKVTMPSGRVVAIDEATVTATAGRVLDKYGRELKDSLVIQR